MIALPSASCGKLCAIDNHEPISDQPIEHGITAAFAVFQTMHNQQIYFPPE